MIGTVVCYGFGTVWLAYQAKLGFGAALAAGVLPFVIGDVAKMVLSILVGMPVRVRVKKAAMTE